MVPWFPLLGLTPSGSFMSSISSLIYTSELILCSTIFVHCATRHTIHMYKKSLRLGEKKKKRKITVPFGTNHQVLGIDVFLMNLFAFFNSKTSIVLAADDSVVSWGPSPTYGELVSALATLDCFGVVFQYFHYELYFLRSSVTHYNGKHSWG